MSKHASEMTLNEIEDQASNAADEAARSGFGAITGLADKYEVAIDAVRELKAHQSKQDAEIARLKAQLDGVLAAVDAEPDYRGTHDATHIKRNIKSRILAEKGES